MARPRKFYPFRLRANSGLAIAICAILRGPNGKVRSGCGPSRPTCTEYRISDFQWNRIRTKFELPDVIDGCNVRAYLEQTMLHAKSELIAERRRSPVGVLRKQLNQICNARAGDPMPPNLHSKVSSLIASMMFFDRRFRQGRVETLNNCISEVRGAQIVSPEIIEWAGWCKMFGAFFQSHDRNSGEGHSFAGRETLVILVRFWREILGKPLENGPVAEKLEMRSMGVGRRAMAVPHRYQSANEFTYFATFCLRHIGERSRDGGKLQLTDVRQRIQRLLANSGN